MKHIFLLFSIGLFASQALALTKETLKIAVYDFSPHVIVDEKQLVPKGSAIDFLTETLDIDGQYNIQWKISPFSRFLADVESGRADIGLFLAKTPEREKVLRYADQPIVTTDAGVILPKDTPFTDLKSLQGKVLGHTQGSVVPNYFHDTGVKFDRLSGEDVVERNLSRLKLKRIDGIYIPTFANGEYYLKKMNMEDQFKIVKIPGTSLELFFVFRKNIDEKTYAHLNSLLNKKRSAYGAHNITSKSGP